MSGRFSSIFLLASLSAWAQAVPTNATRPPVVLLNGWVTGYVNSCPHSRYPLNVRPHEFLTADGALILCRFHGALFERLTGFCVAGPCAGRSLRAVPLQIVAGFVLLADGVDAAELAAEAP